MGNDLKKALADFDGTKALRVAFGKCPECNVPFVVGRWLRWCPKRGCSWLAPK